MDIKPNTGVIRPQFTPNATNPLSGVQPGQRLSATVVESLAGKNLWRLNLEGQSVRAESTAKLVPGQLLRLETVKSRGLPELRIVPPDSSRETLSKTLRNSLPIQRSITELANSLLANSKLASDKNPAANNIARLTREFLSGLPSRSSLTSPDGLKKALNDSGIFLEAKIASLAANSQITIGADLKASILRLVAALRRQIASRNRLKTAPKPDQSAASPRNTAESAREANQSGERRNPAAPAGQSGNLHRLENLLKTAEGAVAKIITEQITSLPKPETQQQTWSLELPYLAHKQPGAIGIKIRREQSRKLEDGEPTWSVTLQLEPPGLAPIQSKITLSGGQINSYFWSKNTDTSQLINTNLSALRQRFLRAGLSAGELNTFNAEPPKNINETLGDLGEEILSERV